MDRPATAEEAIKAAGLDWEVSLRPVTAGGAEVPGYYAVVREDRNIGLGVVKGRYVPIQNREAFSFFDSVVGDGKAIYHTAGALGNGERIWILAKLPDDLVVRGDVTEKYLLLSNGHNAHHALQMLFTPIRVVCQNTLLAALGRAKRTDTVFIRHVGNIQAKVEEARRILGIAIDWYKRFQEAAELLAGVEVKPSALEEYVANLLPMPKGADGEELERKTVLESRLEIVRLFEGEGLGLDEPGIRRTGWALYNAAVEFVDWHRKRQRKDPELRAQNILWGPGADLKRRAFDLAIALAS